MLPPSAPLTEGTRNAGFASGEVAVASAARRNSRIELEQYRGQINELRAMLDQRDRDLQEQASRLDSQIQRARQARREADRYLELLHAVIQESTASSRESSEGLPVMLSL